MAESKKSCSFLFKCYAYCVHTLEPPKNRSKWDSLWSECLQVTSLLKPTLKKNFFEQEKEELNTRSIKLEVDKGENMKNMKLDNIFSFDP